MSFPFARACRWVGAVFALLALMTAQAEEAGRFDVLEYAIEGNTVLETEKVERAVLPYLGPQLGMDAVEAARKALEQAYQDAGFLTVSVDIPEQKVEGGVITLRVQEGKIETLRVTGSRYFSQGVIRAGVPELAANTVPNFNAVQAQLRELGQASADRRLTPLLRPGTTPGTMETELKVDDTLPLHFSAEMNNRQSPETHPGRAVVNLHYDNLWQAGHSFGGMWNVSPKHPSEQNYVAVNYSLPLGRNTLTVSASHSGSDIATVGDTTVSSKGDTVGLRLGRMLRGEGGTYHMLALYTEFKHLKETRNLLGVDSSHLPMTYWRFGGQYDANVTDSWNGTWRFGGALAMGLRGLSGREVFCADQNAVVDQFACRRQGAQPNWATLNAHLARDQRLPWGFMLTAYVDGQVASGPLISNEQYSIGGVDTVRGYLEGERAGDQGWRGRVELTTPDVFERWLDGAAALQFNLFYDHAGVSVSEAPGEQTSRFQLGSAGLGLRLALWRHISAYAEGARVIYDGAYVKRHARRGSTGLSVDF